MSSRIVVFPVMGRRWAFTTALPTGGAQNGPLMNSPPPVMSLRELLKSLRMTPSISEQVDILTSYGSDKMHQQWVALGATPQGSIRRRLHIIGEGMLSRLGPTESFLKAIPKDAGLVEIVYPKCVNPRLVRRRVRHLASSGEVIHRNYMYGSVVLLPFSLLLGILPLPNIILAWNLFRAYSHWRALQGSRRLHYLVTESPRETASAFSPRGDASGEASSETDGSTSTDTKVSEDGKKNQANHWVFLPSEVLETLLVPANVPREPISDVTVSKICKEYPVDPIEILKWRDQRLPIKSFG